MYAPAYLIGAQAHSPKHPDIYKTNKAVHHYNTKGKMNFNVSAKTPKEKYAAIQIFNSLPKELKILTGGKFKKELKKYLINHPIYCIKKEFLK